MNKIFRGALLAISICLAGCASAPTAPEVTFSEEELRQADADLLFATEFPVASKAEALQRADEARKAGQIDKALFFYVKALKFDPRDTELLAAIGLLHQYRGNDEFAVRAFTLALKEDPEFSQVLEARGLILLANGEADRAASDFRRAVSINESAWASHNGLGLIANRRGEHEQALAHYDRALATNPDSADILNNRGYSKLLAGDFAGAEKDLRRSAVELGNDQAWVNLGTLYAHQGDYDQAVAALQEVLSEPEALNKVAEASIANGDHDTARLLLEKAIQASPRYFPAAEENLAQLRSVSESR